MPFITPEEIRCWMGPCWEGERRPCCQAWSAISTENEANPQEMEFRNAIRALVENLTMKEIENGNTADDVFLYLSIHYLFLFILQHGIPWEKLQPSLEIDTTQLLDILRRLLKKNHDVFGDGEWCLTPTQLRRISSDIWTWSASQIFPKKHCPYYAWSN